jgi:hypothetical protein
MRVSGLIQNRPASLSPKQWENGIMRSSCFDKVSVDFDDLESIRKFLMESDIVKGSDELEFIVRQNWPELLYKLVPPRWKMH